MMLATNELKLQWVHEPPYLIWQADRPDIGVFEIEWRGELDQAEIVFGGWVVEIWVRDYLSDGVLGGALVVADADYDLHFV